MGLLSRLIAAVAPSDPPRPVLLRVRSRGGAPSQVEVRARWAPSGRVLTRELTTTDGLCLVPWLTDASAVELRVRAAGATGRVALGLKDTRAGEVVEVSLEERASLPA